jgi:RNA-binding protein
MLTSKQRAFLRKMANGLSVSVQIGKAGVTPEVTIAAAEALTANEIIKVSVLQNSSADTHAAAEMLAGRTRSDVVTVVGGKFTLFKRSKDKPVIQLP